MTAEVYSADNAASMRWVLANYSYSYDLKQVKWPNMVIIW